MINPGAIAVLVAVLNAQQQRHAVDARFERALEKCDLEGCLTMVEKALARPLGGLTKQYIQTRQAMAITLQGQHREALQLLRELNPDSFSRLEKARYFNVAMLSWLLLGRHDAARDLVETQELSGRFMDRSLRDRAAITQAAYLCADGQVEKARATLERLRKLRKPLLNRVLMLLFRGVVEQADGRSEEAAAFLTEAAALAPRTFVPAFVRLRLLDEAGG